MELKIIIIVFIALLLVGGGAFYLSSNSGMVGKFTEAAGFDTAETNCYDELDNDNDGLIDCADLDCNELACDNTGGCLCINEQACEMRTWNGEDDDGDGLVDEEPTSDCTLS